MAFPYVFESNFDAGSNAEWDSESDTGARLDFPHYTELARIPAMPAPYKGAYCMRVQMGDTNDHVLVEGDIDIADADTRFFRFYLFAASNVTATADDTFNIFELQQAGGTVECSLGMRITAASNLLEIGIGDGTAPSTFLEFVRNRWTCIEWKVKCSTGGSGTQDLYIDGALVKSLTSQTHAAAIGRGVLGTQDTLSTTAGVLLFDRFAMDDLQIYPDVQRFPKTVRLTKSAHVFVGPGWIDAATLLSTNGTMDLYDTDTANTNQALAKKVELNTGNNFVANDSPIYFERGCYVVLGGTNPYGDVDLMTVPRIPGMHGPLAHWGDGSIRTYASKRSARAQNV
jgi:hypothetical protein